MKKLLLIFAFAMIFTEAAQAACASYPNYVQVITFTTITRGAVEEVEIRKSGAEVRVKFAQVYVDGKLLTCSVLDMTGSEVSTHGLSSAVFREVAEKALLSGFLLKIDTDSIYGYNYATAVSLSAP